MGYSSYIWRKNNPEKRRIEKKREKVRSKLRMLGYFPMSKSDMTSEQKLIYDQIGNDDYSFWDKVKERNGHNGGKQEISKKRVRTPEELLFMRVKQNSTTKNIVFNLDIEDIIIPEICPILGIPISTNIYDFNSDNYYTLDKIEWNVGFIKGNVRVASVKGVLSKVIKLQKDGYFDEIDYVPDDIIKEIISRARKNARIGKHEFNLKYNDIIVPKFCPYLNVELSFNKKDCKKPYYYSIDRINSKLGYIKGNVQIISILANTMKNNSTKEELIIFAKNILKVHNS